MATGRLIIERNSEADIRMRDLLVRIDELPDFNLNFGQTKQLEIETGPHIITATNRLYADTDSFEISDGQTVAYEVANVPSGCLGALFVGLGMGLYRATIMRLPEP